MVKLGIIGCGRIAETHLSILNRMRNVSIVAVADKEQSRLEMIGRALDVRTYSDYEQLLTEREIDAVLILTPPSTHKDIALGAILAGKKIFCEKPLAPNLEDAQIMVEEAKRKDVFFQTGFVERYDPGKIEIKKIIDKGLIGKPLVMRTKRDVQKEVFYGNSWLLHTSLGGGPIVECLIHDVDQALWFFNSDVKKVYCVAESYTGQHWDNATISLNFANGVTGIFSSSWTLPEGSQWRTETEILGSEGAIRLVSPAPWVEVISEKGIEASFPTEIESLFVAEKTNRLVNLDLAHHSSVAGCFVKQLEDFVDRVFAGRGPLVTGDDGVRALKVVLAAVESAKQGVAIEL